MLGLFDIFLLLSNRQTSSNIVKPSTLGGSFSACLDAEQRLRATQNQRRTNAEATPQRNVCSVRLDFGLSCFRGIHLLAQKVSR